MIHRPEVHDALLRVDDNILKLDTIDPTYINKVDRPTGAYDVNQIIERMKAFNGHIIIQTMPWLEVVKAIKPQQVMVYTIDRETPAKGLEKASREQLDAIRDRVIAAGIPCTASY